MKKCPFCSEEIQDEAVKCRHCGEFLERRPAAKWYLKTSILVLALLCVGPLALPLVWLNTRFSKKAKVVITSGILILTYYLGLWLVSALKSLSDYYKQIF